ncbi:hypothetical protein [uncultured Prevotellamassilia sp.]|uniref:hypothetical protein n=1 Tax=uncultured Prevotellamassilia sp. TaxID=1926676 RepID=UPI002598541F|nr:hypothetical protein [uncultured Prevotellamassilia sp.]
MNNGYVSVPREFFDSIQWRRKRIFTESEAYLDLLQMAYYGSEPTERMVGGAKVEICHGQLAAQQNYLTQRWGWTRYKVRRFFTFLCAHQFAHVFSTPTCSVISVYQGVTSNATKNFDTPFDTPFAHKTNNITKKKITKKLVESSVVCDTTPHAQAEGEVAEAEVSQVAEVAAVAKAATTEAATEVATAEAAAVEAVEVAAEAKAAPAAPKPATRRRTPPMQRPTVWEVENFCRTQGLQLVDAQRFVDYYEANGWKVGRNPMRSWQAAARNWQRRELQYQQPAAMAAINQTNLFTEPNCANNHEHSYAVQPAHDGAKLQQQPLQQPFQQPFQQQRPQQPLQQQLQQPQQPQLQQSQPRVFSYHPQPSLWQRQQCATKAGACAEALEQYAARQMRYFASMGAEEPDF